MKVFKRMYYLVLALAVVFTLNNCSTDEITLQDEEVSKTTNDDLFAKKKASSASGQAGLVFEQGEGGLNGYQSFSFHVSMDADGNASGSWQSNYNDSMDDSFDINTHGTIECVTFIGNRATMSGTITQINAGEFWDFVEPGVNDIVYFEVVDNGEGKKNDPDTFTDVFVGFTGLICFDATASWIVDIPISNGNIQVTNNDATARGGNGNPVIHHVSAGGNDACEAFGLEPGCDGNFSLTANMRADGTVTGQWQDTINGGGNGIHVAIDCMVVDGNTAVVGGYVTHGSLDGEDITGKYYVTKVVDNGTSNNDPADQISYSYDVTPEDCEYWANANFPLFDLTRGQVKIMSK